MLSLDAQIAQAAAALFDARAQRRMIPRVSETYALAGEAAAYAVQEHNTRRWLAEGRALTGRKIGLTSKSVQAQFGIEQPDFGMLWGDLGFSNGARVATERLIQPRVEAEIAFVLAMPLEGPTVDTDDVRCAIDHVLAAIEIVDSAIEDWKLTSVDTIADNASAGGYVLGDTPRGLDEVDLEGCQMTLRLNGEVASQGRGADCMGNPLNAVLWLARKMVEVGRPLAAGDVVLSGALGPMVDARAGDRVEVELDGFAPLRMELD